MSVKWSLNTQNLRVSNCRKFKFLKTVSNHLKWLINFLLIIWHAIFWLNNVSPWSPFLYCRPVALLAQVFGPSGRHLRYSGQSGRTCSFFISFNAFTTGHEQGKISTFTDIRKHSTLRCFQTEVFKSNTLRTSPTVSIQVSIFGSGFVQNIFLFCLPHAFSPQKKDCERLCVSSTKIGTAKVGIVRKVRLNGVGWPFVDENKLCVFFDHGSRKLAFTGYRGDITCRN